LEEFRQPGEVKLFFPYAETHFKFRLPWSPLHKRWPEIFLDAPCQVLSGKPFSVYLLIKDADLYPVTIRSLELRLEDVHGNVTEQQFELNLHCEQNLMYRAFPLSREGFSGTLRLSGWITVADKKGKSVRFLSHNFPGLHSRPLEIRLLNHPLPYPENWKAGEMHCHSEFSSDPVEFGAPLRLMQETADAVGLDFVLCTDHSYDFYYHRYSYLDSIEPEGNFREYRNQAIALNSEHPDLPTLIPGEEVSCGNSHGENVHLLVFGHDHFLPGLGDGGRRGFQNHPDLTIAEILERLPGIPTFAAHPKAQIGWLERKIFRRGEWRQEDLKSNIIQGLQFWNGNLGLDYREGKTFWIKQLLKGQRILPIAANDAHGDFNQNIGVKLPLVSLKQQRSHVFGKVRTVVPCASRDIGALRSAFLGECCVCTDGPFVNVSRKGHLLEVEARSNPDFGSLHSVHVYVAESGACLEKVYDDWSFAKDSMELKATLPSPKSGYVRAEVVTRNGNRALCSALFVN